MGRLLALLKTFTGAVLPAIAQFIVQHIASIGVCFATLCFCMFAGVKMAIIIAFVSLVVAVLCQRDSMETIRKYYEEEMRHQNDDK